MKFRSFVIVFSAGLALTACGKPASDASGKILGGNDNINAAETAAFPNRTVMSALDKSKAIDAGTATDTISVPQLAYDYDYHFAAPADGVEALIKADQTACEKAGVAACQMISLSANNNADAGFVSKTLELRVTPQWLKAWQGGLPEDLKKAHARISSQNVTSEDLSLQIVDSEAHIKNKVALRDRLIAVIKSNPGKIADLIEAETQLSQVQQEIDSAQSALAVMQKRVATSHLTLTYESEATAASQGAFAPVNDALRSILRNMMTMFGVIIQVLSFLIPLGVVIGPVVWMVLKWQSRRKAAKSTPQPPQPGA